MLSNNSTNWAMRNFYLFAVTLLVASSCSRSISDMTIDYSRIWDDPVLHEMIVLGAQLEDPYSIDNMTKALENLYPTKAARVVLESTHYYLRFLPKNEEEFVQLEEYGLELLDHPVDYEIVQEGDYYHDPSIPEDEYTWQYAVVTKDAEIPQDIYYEILDECYIPSESDVQTRAGGIDWAAVEEEAYRLTGNLDKDALTKGSESGTPRGRITIVDSKLGSEAFGVKGVKVSCNSFVKFAHTFTDADGNYAMSKTFNSKPRYRLVFKNKYGFGIGFNLLIQPASASTLGKNSPTGLSVTITSSSERKLFTRCVVNNAAYDYYTDCKNNDGSISTPPSNLRIWLFQNLNCSSAVMLRQGAIVDNSIISDFLGDYTFLLKMFLPDITLGLKGINSSYADIYSVTVHELAHASHFMVVGKEYWDMFIKYILTSFISSGFVTYGAGTEENHGYCEVGEMWAYYLETMLYRERYNDPDIAFGQEYWFHPQIFIYLDDRGLTRSRIFPALTSEVTDKDILKKKLISMYPEFKSAINYAFGRYN